MINKSIKSAPHSATCKLIISLILLALFFVNPSHAYIIWQNNQWQAIDSKAFDQTISLKDQVAAVLENQHNTTSSDLLPIAVKVQSAKLHNLALIISLEFPEEYLDQTFSEATLEAMSQVIDLNIDTIAPTARHIHFNTIYKGRKVALSNLLRIDPVPNKDDDNTAIHQQIKTNQGTVTDLSDKTLFISQAHGWIDYDDFREWSTQRGITHDIVEDFVNSEGINQYLLQYLAGAGAEVFTMRERDMNTEMVIVDDQERIYR